MSCSYIHKLFYFVILPVLFCLVVLSLPVGACMVWWWWWCVWRCVCVLVCRCCWGFKYL